MQSSWLYECRKTDFDGSVSFLLNFGFSPMLESSDIEFAWSFIKHAIRASITLNTKTVQIRPCKYLTSFTPNICHQLSKIHSLRKRFESSPSFEKLVCLPSAEYRLRHRFRQALLDFEESLISTMCLQKMSKFSIILRNSLDKMRYIYM